MSDFVFEWLLSHAQKTPNAPCLGSPATGWQTYASVADAVLRCANVLRQHGVVAQSRVLISLPHVPAGVVASLAVQSLGATSVEIDRERNAASLSDLVKLLDADVAFITGRDAQQWTRVDKVRALIVVHPAPLPDKMKALLAPREVTAMNERGEIAANEATSVDRPEAIDPSAVAQLVFTSGTTGIPRGVMQSHRNIASNARGIAEYLKLSSNDRASLILPLFYVYGKSVVTTHLWAGASIYLDDRFMYPRVVLDAMAEQQCTGFAGVPLTFELIRRQIDTSTINLSSLRYLTQAGGAMAQDTIDWVRHTFYPAQLFVMYGQTEATARLSYLPPDRSHDKKGSIGRGMPGVTLRVVDDSGADVKIGETGHLIAQGDNITQGYFQAPNESAEILRDGWLWTGDLASRDLDGFIYIQGRSREMLKLGGHRVAPAEIETALASMSGVEEVAVVGTPDDISGERAIAFVVRQPNVPLSDHDLLKAARQVLPAYKVPSEIVFLDALPRTTSGKVARNDLRLLAAQSPRSTNP